MSKLNVATKLFAENSSGGLMICGINWGGEEKEKGSDQEEPSFFSDSYVNRYPYRDRLVTWFELLGHPLIRERGKEGWFERSIVQTNWLNTQSPDMRGKSIYNECIQSWSNMELHLNSLRPRLIVFLSVSLLDALNSKSILPCVETILGEAECLRLFKKDVYSCGKRLKRFRVGVQRFKLASIIALPHPTGSIGVSSDYIAEFKDEIFPIITSYRGSNG